MVNTLVLYDVPTLVARQRLESVLRRYGFVWLFPHARWSSHRLSHHAGLMGAARSRLAGHAYRLVFIEMAGRARTRAVWLTNDPKERHP
jgi:hypothetical protein